MADQQLHLNLDRTVILVGAGASVASGIATGQMFNRILLPYLVPSVSGSDERTSPLVSPIPAKRRPGKGNIRFEQLVEILRQTVDPDLLIMQYLETTWMPSAIHQWIAHSISKGSIVLTTNLDSLIELAYREEFGKSLKQIVEEDEYLGIPQDTPSLIKLHGTIRREGYLAKVTQDQPPPPFAHLAARALDTFRVTLDAIGSLPATPQGTKSEFLLPDYVLDALRQILPGRDLLVIGYSGSDDFDITPSLRQLAPSISRMVWIDHRPDCESQVRTRGNFFHIRGDTNRTLEVLFGNEVPLAQRSSFDPKEGFISFCDEWSKRIELTEAARYLMSGAILHSMGFLSNALSIWEEGLEDVRSGDLLSIARYCNALGFAYLTEQSYAYAQDVFEVALSRIPKIKEPISVYETQLLSAPEYTQAMLGFAFIQIMVGTMMADDSMKDEGFLLLMSFYEMGTPGSSTSVYEVRAGIFLSQIIRNQQPGYYRHGMGHLLSRVLFRTVQDIPSDWIRWPDGLALQYSRGSFDLGALLEHYLHWPILEKNKVLRAGCLKELALWYRRQRKEKMFGKCQDELFFLCTSLNLAFLRSTYLLELADLTGQTDIKTARVLYLQAGNAFQQAGYPVGHAEACLGAAVMGILAGDRTEARELLTTAIRIFQNHHCHWNIEQCEALIRNLILLRGEAGEMQTRLGASHPELIELLGKQENGFNPRSLMMEIKRRFYQTLRDHWREGLGMAGWVTSHDLNGDKIYDGLLIPW